MNTANEMLSQDAISRVERALTAIAAGEIVILIDAEDRENEGDLCMAADLVTADHINFMATHGRGLICLTLTEERINSLKIPMMVDQNSSPFQTAFTVSIEASEGVTTGISAADRARTIQAAVAPDARPRDIVMPGHIFPLRARAGGVLVRTGQTEGSVDLARMAGLTPAGVICEIMNEDGTMARLSDLETFAEEHQMVLLSVSDLIAYRLQRESLLEVVEDAALPTEYGPDWRVKVYKSLLDGSEHLAFVCGTPRASTPTLVRVQPRSDTFELFTSRKGGNLGEVSRCMEAISKEGTGILVYLDKDSASASDLVRHYVYKEKDSPDARAKENHVNQPKQALRALGIGAQILRDNGCGQIKVMTNRPKKIVGTDGFGIEIVAQIPIPTFE